MIKQFKRFILFASIVILWEIAGKAGLINKFLLPAPSTIVSSEIFLDFKIFSHALSSFQRVLVGYSISTIAAVVLGFAIGLNKTLRFYLMPIFSLVKPVPPIAWIPITILWFGLGNGPSYFVTMIASFFPIFFNTINGVDDLDPQYINVAKCFGTRRLQMFKEVIFPFCLPYIFSGMRIGLGVAWMSVIAAEIVSSTSGLGYMMEISQQMMRVDNLFIGMFVIGICGIALDFCIQKMSQRLVRWKY